MCQSPQEAPDVSWGRCALKSHSVNNSAKVDDLEGLKVQSIEFIQMSDSWRVSGARKKLKFNCHSGSKVSEFNGVVDFSRIYRCWHEDGRLTILDSSPNV